MLNAFKDANFYPKSLIVQQDLSGVGTIERAIKFNNFKSLKLLLEFLFDVVNTHDYHRFIMSDFLLILGTQQVQVNDFFVMSDTEKKGGDQDGFCNFEITFKNAELPSFSD